MSLSNDTRKNHGGRSSAEHWNEKGSRFRRGSDMALAKSGSVKMGELYRFGERFTIGGSQRAALD